MTTDRNVDSKITEEALARLRARLNEETPILYPWNSEAAKDSIWQWCNGIGDLNPLWVDPEYAKKAKDGALLAPPSFLYSCNQGPMHRGAGAGGFRGFPGVHRFWAKEAWEWFLPIRRNDEIRGTTKVKEMIEHQSSLAGRSIEDVTEQAFRNQRGELIAKHWMHFINTERRAAAEKGKHREFQKARYTDEEIRRIWADIDKEVVRGAEPRYWEDVQAGEEIPQVVKGPYTSSEAVAFVAGWGGPFIMASEITQRFVRAHPKANVPDRQTNAPDFPERAHWDDAFAREVGAPGAYDFGGQRVAWLIHALTNWMGDDGFLRHLEAKLVKFNVFGDATWCKGRVTGKSVEGGEHLAHLDVWGVNQRGETNVAGQAKVRLPRRG